MKKVCYGIFDVNGSHFWPMDFRNKREAESYLYHSLRDEYYDKVDSGIWRVRGYIKDRQHFFKVLKKSA